MLLDFELCPSIFSTKSFVFLNRVNQGSSRDPHRVGRRDYRLVLSRPDHISTAMFHPEGSKHQPSSSRPVSIKYASPIWSHERAPWSRDMPWCQRPYYAMFLTDDRIAPEHVWSTGTVTNQLRGLSKQSFPISVTNSVATSAERRFFFFLVVLVHSAANDSYDRWHAADVVSRVQKPEGDAAADSVPSSRWGASAGGILEPRLHA